MHIEQTTHPHQQLCNSSPQAQVWELCMHRERFSKFVCKAETKKYVAESFMHYVKCKGLVGRGEER